MGGPRNRVGRLYLLCPQNRVGRLSSRCLLRPRPRELSAALATPLPLSPAHQYQWRGRRAWATPLGPAESQQVES